MGPPKDLAENAPIAVNPWNRYTASALSVEDAFKKVRHRDTRDREVVDLFICRERKINESSFSSVDQGIRILYI